VERTHIGPKVGTATTYEFANLMEVGIFYQQATTKLEAEYGRPLMVENQFMGITMAAPLLSAGPILVKLNVRTGISNGQNFVITPALLGSLKILKRIDFQTGVGTRNFKPTLVASASFKL
jgi:hypothetical protein